MRNLLFYIISFILLPYSGYATNDVFTIKHLNMGNGLSSNYVNSVAQDKKGYIWMATDAGLNRFDGNSFNIYTSKNSALADNEVTVILGDNHEDILWVGTNRNGLYYYEHSTETIKPVPLDNTNGGSNDIAFLKQASNGNLWITRFRQGVTLYNHLENKTTHYSGNNVVGLPNNYTCAVDDGKDNLYIGHSEDGLTVLSLTTGKLKRYTHKPNDLSSLPSNYVQTVFIDKEHHIWIGTNKGLALLDPKTDTFTLFKHVEGNPNSLLSDQVRDIAQMSDGTIWICSTMGGVSILNLKRNIFNTPQQVQFRNITASMDNQGLSGPNAQHCIEDSFGNIWIANYRGGVDMVSYDHPPFAIFNYAANQQADSNTKQVWGLLSDHRQQLWVCTKGEVAIYNNGKRSKTILFSENKSQANTHARTIFQDSKNNIWIGLYRNGILLYNNEKGSISRFGEQEFADLDIFSFYEDNQGKIWVSTHAGLYSIKGNDIIAEEAINNLLSNKRGYSIVEDKLSNMWISTYGDGIFILTPQKELLAHVKVNDKFATNAIAQLFKDSRGRILGTSRDGLIIFHHPEESKQYTIYGENEGLENLHVRAIQEDLEGNIWISTNGGISRLDETEQRFYNYNNYDGIPSGDFMDGATCITEDGVIYLGSQNGACHFIPQKITAKREASPAVITGFSVYNKPTEAKTAQYSVPVSSGEVILPYNENTFRISFNVLDYTQNEQVEYMYQMSGFENSWYNTHADNQVVFRNIAPGNYIFKVKSRIRNQEWGTQVSTLKIKITPPIWATWYAKMCYALLLIAILYILFRNYKRKVYLESSLEMERRKAIDEQELNSERLRFYTNITHELRTPLTLILGPLEDLLNDYTLSPKHANRISIIHDSANRLLGLINQILEFRKTETQNRSLTVSKQDLSLLIREIGLRYKELNQNSKVEYLLNIEAESSMLYYDTEMITIILNNLLSNAAKYTPEGTIGLTLRETTEEGEHYTEIVVSDTGYGISSDALPHIFDRYYQAKGKYQASGSGIGLALVKGLCELHQAELRVDSEESKGTTFTLRLLTSNSYPNAIHKEVEQKESPKKEPRESIEESPEASSQEDAPALLVVEDNPDIREYIRVSLADKYEVTLAKDGQEGWDKAISLIPNIVVSDVMMPHISGIELCKMIKGDIRTSHIPVVLLTAKDSLKDKEEGYTSGADSYITKPFSASLLQSRLSNLMESRKRLAAIIASSETAVEKEALSSSLNKLDNEFVQKITAIIEEYLDMDKMDVAFIAEKMCMSHSTLYRKIKGLTDMSANEFIRKVKMRNGVRLLLEGKNTISEISYMTGFSSVAYFRQCFKDEYGMSPSEYLKQNSPT